MNKEFKIEGEFIYEKEIYMYIRCDGTDQH